VLKQPNRVFIEPPRSSGGDGPDGELWIGGNTWFAYDKDTEWRLEGLRHFEGHGNSSAGYSENEKAGGAV